MEHEAPLAVVQRIWEQWARGEYANAELYDPQMVYIRAGEGLPGEAGIWQGLDQVWPAVATYLAAWENISQTAERFIEVDEERVLVLDRQRGRGAKSGIEVDHPLAHLVTVRDGKVVQLEAYWDRRDAFAAAGIAPGG